MTPLYSRIESNEIVIYKEKWKELLATLVIILVCMSAAVLFFLNRTPDTFGYLFLLFGCILLLFGMGILIPLIIKAKQVFEENGVVVLRMNVNGIQRSVFKRFFCWSDITQIFITRNLKIIDDEESQYIKNAIVFFLSDSAAQSSPWVSKSGKGRAYIIDSVPGTDIDPILAALNYISPKNIDIKAYSKVIFNHIKGDDLYDDSQT